MKALRHSLLLFVLSLSISGCTTMCSEQVPPGHVGMCRTMDGFQGDILPPGWHSCWGASEQMYYVETTDYEEIIHMSVLCKDSLNFRFDVSVLSAVDKDNVDLIKALFENITPAGDGSIISAQQIFGMYAKNIVDQEARKVVSKYATSEIVSNRQTIIEEIRSSVSTALKGSVIIVKRITVNNLDFPQVVTQAQEDRARRQVEIETERAEQKKRLLQAENELKIAELEYKRELVQAAMISDANKIIGASITPEYLAWWQLKVMGEAARGPNNWGLIPYTDFSSSIAIDPQKWTQKEAIIDAELRRRIDEARALASPEDLAEPELPPSPEAPLQP